MSFYLPELLVDLLAFFLFIKDAVNENDSFPVSIAVYFSSLIRFDSVLIIGSGYKPEPNRDKNTLVLFVTGTKREPTHKDPKVPDRVGFWFGQFFLAP